MEAINIEFAPATGTEEEWNEAYARLADYYRAFRLHNRIRRTQLILETLRRAADAHREDPGRSPTAHAIGQARLMLHEWLGTIYRGMELTHSQIEASGRLGFHLCDGPNRWPHFFLDREHLPEDMGEAMRSAVRASGPGLQISKMTPREIDLGRFTEVAEDTIDTLGRSAGARYALLGVLAIGVLWYFYRLFQ